jgi:hypothetical protein
METDDKRRIKGILRWMTAGCILIVLAGINRLAHINFLSYYCADILRIRDVAAVFILAPLVMFCIWKVFEISGGMKSRFLLLILVAGFYCIGVGFGMHEPFNVFVSFYRRSLTPEMERSVIFFDDKLGHWVFFAGFVAICVSLALAELKNPFREALSFRYLALPVFLAVVSGFVIFVNMALEETGTDIAVIALTAAFTAGAHFYYSSLSLKKLPIVFALYISLAGSSTAVILYWLALS